MAAKEMPPVRGRRRTEVERAGAFSRQSHFTTQTDGTQSRRWEVAL